MVKIGIHLVLVLAMFVAAGAASEPSIELTATPTNAELGDSVELSISYRWNEDWTPARAPNPSLDLGNLHTISLKGPVQQDSGDVQVVNWTAKVLLETSGTWLVPQPSLTFQHRDGHSKRVTAAEVFITVGSGASEATLPELRGLWLPPEELTETSTTWWPYALTALLIFVIGTLWLLRHRTDNEQALAKDIFQHDLRAARAIGDGREAGVRLSTALRRYCGAIEQFDGVGATGPEVIQRCSKLPAAARSELRHLLEQLDGLLWAPAALASATVSPLLDQAERWVTQEEQRRAQLAEEQAANKNLSAGQQSGSAA